MPFIMWRGNLATAVCLCRYVKRKRREVNDGRKKARRVWRGAGGEPGERARRGLLDTGTVVISEQSTRRTEQHVDSDRRI